jgi:hypothetical protein
MLLMGIERPNAGASRERSAHQRRGHLASSWLLRFLLLVVVGHRDTSLSNAGAN